MDGGHRPAGGGRLCACPRRRGEGVPRGLVLLVLVLVAMASAWYGVVRRGAARVVGLVLAALALGGALALVVARGAPLQDLLIVAGSWRRLLRRVPPWQSTSTCRAHHPRAIRCSSSTHAPVAERPSASRWPRRRPSEGSSPSARRPETTSRSSSGMRSSAARTDSRWRAGMARRRSWQPSRPNMGCRMPGACRHAQPFALDLGVDRDDVVGALDAFVDGGERRVDLAEVNGRVFVNNVSLGLYADAVQRAGYRDAKIRTLLDTVPDVLGPDEEPDMRWRGPAGTSTAAVPRCWSPTTATGSGVLSARHPPRIDDGLLGVTVVGSPTGRGEAAALRSAPGANGPRRRSRSTRSNPPRRHRRRDGGPPRATALSHPSRGPAGAHRPPAPGASPSAMVPEGMRAGVAELARIALGRQQRPTASTQGRH